MSVARTLGFAAVLCISSTSAANAQVPSRWECDPAAFEDGVCDCGCGASDTDCSESYFTVCERSACSNGNVPWEHAPWNCMSSSCGDGWRDELAGEACDDFEALDSGGCTADCATVNSGWACGDGADGCWPDDGGGDDAEPDVGAVDASDNANNVDAFDDTTAADASLDVGTNAGSDAGAAPVPQSDSAGCTTAPAAPSTLGLGALVLLGLFGRRRS